MGKILPNLEGEGDVERAAAELLAHLKVVVGQSNNVLLVKYSHEDSAVTKEVLHELMDAYFQKHLLIHRSAAAFDLVAKQADEVKKKLSQTEEKLNKLRTESGIISLERQRARSQVSVRRRMMSSSKCALLMRSSRRRSIR